MVITWYLTTKSCIFEKSNIVDQVKAQKLKCSTDESLQKNFQHSELKLTHWYCKNSHVSDLITYICTLNLAILGDLCRNGYRSETKQQKIVYLQIHKKLTWSIYKKEWNAVSLIAVCINKNGSFVQHELHWVLWLICFIYLPCPLSSLLGDVYRNGNQPEHRNSKQPEIETWKVEYCGSVKCQTSIAIYLSLCKIMSTI